ncbi:MAG: long-chain fatty acid--CoA ligase [Legionellales bacterium]|nr:long-chain fatty acid--CoA ligase [Legionellales bacterium]HAG61716.1 long-chain fatty acid--CoA ligase [Coxiellaceae bacterium]
MEATFTNLVAMQQSACQCFSDRPLFGTKIANQYQWITYAEFAERVNQCRAGLAQLGIGPGDAVAFISNNRTEWAIAAYAAFGLEALFIPMYLDQHADDWAYIINDCQATALFTSKPQCWKKIDDIKANIPSVKNFISLDEPQPNTIAFHDLCKMGEKNPMIAKTTQQHETCCIGYTSGTTGKPKGVMLSHQNFLFEVNAGLLTFKLTPEDRSLSFLPWAHIFGHVTEVHAVIQSGMSTALVKDIQDILDDLVMVKPTIMYAVPRIFSKIYTGVMEKIARKPKLIQSLFYRGLALTDKQTHKHSLTLCEQGILTLAKKIIFKPIIEKFGGRLRLAISGASALSPKVIHFLHQIGIPLYEGYGLTETTSAITVNTQEADIVGAVGKAFDGCKIVIDPNNRITEDEGEVICYGPNVMQGYYNQPEKTREIMTEDGGFRTGDIGKLNEDGFLFITGRVKDQFKLENGKFVAPAPIEEQIKLKPLFSHALIYGANRPFVTALLVIDTSVLRKIMKKRHINGSIEEILKKPKIQRLIAKLLKKQVESFKSYEKPKEFILLTEDWTIDNELLTPTLKIKRKNIEEKYSDLINTVYEKQGTHA